MVRDSQAGRYIWDGVAAFDDLLDGLFFEFRRNLWVLMTFPPMLKG